MAKKTTSNTLKVETVEEFLARGGKIQKIAPVEIESKEVSVRATTNGPVNMMSTTSTPFEIKMTKEEFEEAIKKIDNLSQDQKDKIMDMAENMTELSYQSPGLEEAAIMFGEKVTRKKKERTIDRKEVERWSSFLPKDVQKKLGL